MRCAVFPGRGARCMAQRKTSNLGLPHSCAFRQAVPSTTTPISRPRRCLAHIAHAAAPMLLQEPTAIVTEMDQRGVQRLKYQPEGWNFWDWEGYRIHYVAAGPEEAPPIVLVHGYGASAYHWRYTIPALAGKYRVYAVDMLGFGWSQKATDVEYSGGRLWSRQLSAFVKEVGQGRPVVMAGNSLGGYASLATAVAFPETVRGLVLLNSAGPFAPAGWDINAPPPPAPTPSWLESVLAPIQKSITASVQRVVLYFAFLQARQPERIKQVLDLVYFRKEMVDGDLVASIQGPAQDPKASEVFYLVQQTQQPVYLETLFSQLKDLPVLLLWGDLDPWMTPSRATRIMGLYPAATKVSLQSGHCPHDDTPEEANAAFLQFLEDLPS